MDTQTSSASLSHFFLFPFFRLLLSVVFLLYDTQISMSSLSLTFSFRFSFSFSLSCSSYATSRVLCRLFLPFTLFLFASASYCGGPRIHHLGFYVVSLPHFFFSFFPQLLTFTFLVYDILISVSSVVSFSHFSSFHLASSYVRVPRI